jgi:ParB/RepB/Spo0J family partition protein
VAKKKAKKAAGGKKATGRATAKKGARKKAKKKTLKKKAARKKQTTAEEASEALGRALEKRLAETKPGYRPCRKPKPGVMPISSLRVARSARDEDGGVSELVDSIRANGLLVPLVVSPEGEVLDGRRRLQALNDLDITEVPVVIAEAGAKGHIVEIVTNVMREDFTPGERARAYRTAMQVLHLTQAQLGEMVGVSQQTVAEAVAVLDTGVDGDIGYPISDENDPESPEEPDPEPIVDGRKSKAGVASGEARKKATEKRQEERVEGGGKPRGRRPEWKQQDKGVLDMLPDVVALKVSVDKIRITADLPWPDGEELSWRGIQIPKTMAVGLVSHCQTLRERLHMDLEQAED